MPDQERLHLKYFTNFYAWLLIAAIPVIYGVLYVNNFHHERNYSLSEKADNAHRVGNSHAAAGFYRAMLEDDPQNVVLHRNYLRVSVNSVGDIDDEVINEYYELSQLSDSDKTDLGNYALGFIAILQDNENKALELYAKVENRAFPYLQNSIGYAYLELENYQQAEAHFRTSIEIEDNAQGAYSYLSKIYLKTNNNEGIAELVNDESTVEYVSSRVKRQYYFKTGQVGRYLTALAKRRAFTGLSLIGGLLTLSVWLVYLVRVDVFERESPHHIGFALVLGGVFMMCAIPLYDSFSVFFGFDLNGETLNDFLYCIFGIGLIEESVKIIPFLILLRFKSIVNESTDYIVYASLVALSFAFLENLLYFYPDNLEAITGRLLTANVLHIALTSFIAFSILYAKKKKRSVILYFLMGFAFSIFVHGVYDFFLITESDWRELKILSLGIAATCILLYARALHQALSWSEFNDSIDTEIRSMELLMVAIMLVVAFQYVAIGTSFGADNANMSLGTAVFFLMIFGPLLVGGLGRFRILKSVGTNR